MADDVKAEDKSALSLNPSEPQESSHVWLSITASRIQMQAAWC